MPSSTKASLLDDRRPVTIVCSDVSNNCLGRALLLAELVPEEIEARVIGVQLGAEIWKPAAGFSRPVTGRFIEDVRDYPAAARWLRGELRGSRVVVSKPVVLSLGLTLRAGVAPDGLLLDVDDWEIGLTRGKPTWRNFLDFVNPRRLNSYWSIAWMDGKVGDCSRRLVSNDWLSRRYGGTVLPHVRDTERLDPAKVERERWRAELGMAGFWVGFVGTMRPHKGNRELVDAVRRAGDHVGLFFAGANTEDCFVRGVLDHARATLGEERVRVVPVFPFDELPRWLALPDVIALPSLATDAAVGQIPAKLFDAMAMAKPVIASAVNDAEGILGGTGVIVPPGDVEQLARAIASLERDEARRTELGSRARRRAEERFSYRVGRDILTQALERLPPFGGVAN